MLTCHILNFVGKLSYSVKNENERGCTELVTYVVIIQQIKLFFKLKLSKYY